MKKIVSYISIFLLAVSCETPVFIEPIGPEKEILLQACLQTIDQQHTVLAAYALHDQIIPAQDLTLNCFVNGELVAVGSGRTDRDNQYTSYQFTATIQPGDSVRIEAIGPQQRAVARVKAPKALPVVPQVTVERVTVYDTEGDAISRIRFHIPVQDIPNERNWYRINTYSRNVEQVYITEENRDEYMTGYKEPGWNSLFDGTEFIELSNTKDAVLNPDGREGDSFRPDYLANQHHFFTDELFEDKQNEFILDGVSREYVRRVSGIYSGYQYRNTITAIFDIQCMPHEDFMRSRLLEMRDFNVTGMPIVDNLFSEDMILPENVEGGIGLVSIRTVTRAEVVFGPYGYNITTGFLHDLDI